MNEAGTPTLEEQVRATIWNTTERFRIEPIDREELVDWAKDQMMDIIKQRDQVMIEKHKDIRKSLKWALDNLVEHHYGCLYCGGDDEYVGQYGEVSKAHKKVCKYYKAIRQLGGSGE